jgi:peptide/nickel transport system substrate-binding protein
MNKSLRSFTTLMFAGALLLVTACAPAQPAAQPAAPAEAEATAVPPTEPAKAEEPTAAPEAPAAETTEAKCGESPMLAEQVKAGKLPPCEERVPSEPLVANPHPQLAPWVTETTIGNYGGTLRLVDYDKGTLGHDAGWLQNEFWLATEGTKHDSAKTHGNIFRDYKISDDAKEITFYMRKGMKYSDGSPFTTEDVAFWWNSVMLNETLTPIIGSNWRSGRNPSGEVLKLEVIDDFTFKFISTEPFGGITGLLTYATPNIPSSDFMKKYHGDFTKVEDMEPLIKELGYQPGEWWRVFGFMGGLQGQIKYGYPVLSPYVVTEVSDSRALMARNPYYWKVDAAGNQLPYIDNVEVTLVNDVEAATLKVIAGEVDLARRPVNPKSLPLYKQYEKEKDYTVAILPQHASLGEVFLNLTNKDENWRAVIGNAEVRKALSMAIDRKAIIDSVYFGIAEPGSADYPQPDYDPQGAAAILDKAGLDKKDADGCRLGPDGNAFIIPWELSTFTGEEVPVAEQVSKFWKEVGICSQMKNMETNLFLTTAGANELHAFTWWFHFMRHPWHENGDYVGVAWQQTYAPLWYRNYNWEFGGGKTAPDADKADDLVKGETPPDYYVALRDKQNAMFASADPAEQKRLWDEMRQIITDNYLFIPIVDPVKGPLVYSNKLGNVPTDPNAVAIELAAAAEVFFFK